MKTIVPFIICFVFTLISYGQTLESLRNDKLIKKHFNKKDIENLHKIMNFFDQTVKQNCDDTTLINICYQDYCDKIKSNADSGSLDPGFTYEIESQLLNDLDKRSFNKIWYYTESYRVDKGVKVYYFPRTIELSYKSPFMNLCKDISDENPAWKFYYENYQTAGTMNSDMIEGVLSRYEKFIFSEIRERLLFAIHYLTMNSRKFK